MSAESQADKLDRKGRRNEFRRKSILMAARDLFVEHAFDELTIESIAEAAAVSKATLYQYFNNKADIYDAILMSDVAELVDGLEKSWSADSRFSTNLRRMTYFYVSFFVRHQEYFTNLSFFYLPGRHIPLPPATMTQVRAQLSRAIAAISACIESAIAKGEIQTDDPTTTSMSIYSVWEGVAWAHATGRCTQFDRDVYDVTMRGIDLISAGLRLPTIVQGQAMPAEGDGDSSAEFRKV